MTESEKNNAVSEDIKIISDVLNEAETMVKQLRKILIRLHQIMWDAANRHSDRIGVEVSSVIPKVPNQTND